MAAQDTGVTERIRRSMLDPSGETAPEEWRYRAEGRAHLVYTYTGPLAAYARRILRIRKPSAKLSDSEELSRAWKEDLLPKLLSPDLLVSFDNVELQPEWTGRLFAITQDSRPTVRQEETGRIVLGPGEAVVASVMSDITASGVGGDLTMLAIEIKPKWGFLPDAQHITPPEAAEIKSAISRFELHEHYREEHREEGYNPLDLFSGEQARVKKALDGLWSSWALSSGSKNNLRVYVNGRPVTPENSALVPTTNPDLSTGTAPFVIPTLLSSGVFEQLKNLQSTLDPVDISTIASLFQAAHPSAPLFDSSLIPDPTLTELQSFIGKYLSGPSCGSQEESWSLREYIIAYSLSAIFKDCSVFISIPLSKPAGEWIVGQGASVKVIDLDLKSVKSMRKWYDLDEAIWRHWYEAPPQSR